MNDIGILILRVTLSSFMLTHGISKLQELFEGPPFSFADPIGAGPFVSLVLAVLAEFLCSILVIIGLKTRLVAIPLVITMFIAAFIVHGADPFMKKELALVYMTGYISIIFLGGGKYSLDYFTRGRRN